MSNPERRRLLGKIALGGGFGLLVFFVSFYLSFPYHRVKDQIVAMAAQQNLDVEIGEAGPALGIGLALGDIRIATRPLDGSKPLRFQIESATVTIAPLAHLRGEQAFSVAAEALGGEVDLDVGVAKTGGEFRARASGIGLGELPWVKQAINLPLAGTLNLNIDLATPNHRYAESNGAIGWKCSGCAIGDGKSKLQVKNNPLLAEGISLPKIRLGELTGRVNIEKGMGKLVGVQAKSPDGELFIEGEVRLVDPPAMSYLNAYVRFKLSDALLKSSDKLALMLQIMESMGKRPDGYYGFRLTGPLGNLSPPEWAKSSPFVTAAAAPARPPSPPRPTAPRPKAPAVVEPLLNPNANLPRYPSEPPSSVSPTLPTPAAAATTAAEVAPSPPAPAAEATAPGAADADTAPVMQGMDGGVGGAALPSPGAPPLAPGPTPARVAPAVIH